MKFQYKTDYFRYIDLNFKAAKFVLSDVHLISKPVFCGGFLWIVFGISFQ